MSYILRSKSGKVKSVSSDLKSKVKTGTYISSKDAQRLTGGGSSSKKSVEGPPETRQVDIIKNKAGEKIKRITTTKGNQKRISDLDAQGRLLAVRNQTISKAGTSSTKKKFYGKERATAQRSQDLIDRGYYYDFGTGKAVPRPNVQQQPPKSALTRITNTMPSVRNYFKKRGLDIPPITTQQTVTGVGVVYPRNEAERKFFIELDKVIKRDKRFKKMFTRSVNAYGLNINDSDKWFTRALKGVGQAGVGVLFSGSFLSNALDKAYIGNRGVFTSENIRQAVRDEQFRALKETPKAVAQSFDPKKPENWANILLAVGGVRAIVKGVVNTGQKAGLRYAPSVRNAGAISKGITQRLASVRAMIKLTKTGIKASKNVRSNARLLSKLVKLERQLQKSQLVVRRISRNPKILKLEDLNPLIESRKLINQIGKERTVFHATATRPKDLLGATYKKFKTTNEILKAVEKNTKKTPTSVKTGSAFEKQLLNLLKDEKAIISGARSQNAFVKALLKRKTVDFDVIVKSPSSVAKKMATILKRTFPKSKIKVVAKTLLDNNNKKIRVYTLKVNGKSWVDFSSKKGVSYKVVDGVRLADPKYLAKMKLGALKNPAKFFRSVKDIKDLRRLVGSLFSDKKFSIKVKDPKNYFTIRPRPQGMGASRLRFGETQMFFDFTVPTTYAYNSLVKNVIPKWLLKVAQKVGFKKSFIKKLDSLKYVKASDRLTILKVKVKISNFPKRIITQINKAKKGLLSARETAKLRTQINNYINKNPNKAFVGSRTGSQALGEREIVIPSGSSLKLKGKKYGRDAQTGLYFDVLEFSLKKTKTRWPKSFKQAIRKIARNGWNEIKARLTPSDLAKVRRYQRQFKKADKLTSKQYKDFISITEKIINRVKGVKKSKTPIKASVKKVASKVKRKAPATPKRKTTAKTGFKRSRSIDKDIAIQMLKQKGKIIKTRRVKTVKRKTPQAPKRKTTRTATRPKTKDLVKDSAISTFKTRNKPQKNIRRKTTPTRKRPKIRVVSRAKTRPRTRTSPRKRPRTTTRVSKRATPRPRKRVTPRIRPRVTPRPRKRVTPRIRPRVTPRPRPRARPRPRPRPPKIPKKFRIKIKTAKQKKELEDWFKKQPVEYRPSLASVLFNITGYKLPKRLTGLELRPIIKRRIMRKKRK